MIGLRLLEKSWKAALPDSFHTQLEARTRYGSMDSNSVQKKNSNFFYLKMLFST